MIILGIGANLPAPGHAGPRETCEAALRALDATGVRVLARSVWYRTAPVPVSDQPWYVNAVVAVDVGGRSADELMAVLHGVERAFGRVRSVRNAARTLDLDLLDFDGAVSAPGDTVELPHPRLHERAFVLLPLAEVAPDWRHPISGIGVAALIAALPDDQAVERAAED